MKAEQFHDASVHEVEEDYTSKTCSSCGDLKDDLGSNKTYSCSSCSSIFDRDFNAAYIMLKYICEHLMASGGSSISSARSGGNGQLAMMAPGPFVR